MWSDFKPFAFLKRLNQTMERINSMTQTMQSLHDQLLQTAAQIKQHTDAAVQRVGDKVDALKTEITNLQQQISDQGANVDFSDVNTALNAVDAEVQTMGQTSAETTDAPTTIETKTNETSA
jgi:chromosome segregation ATPase